ncbi:MAG: response regulator, partial [Acidobacteriota bacterium]|nr:response regulator [Acidobacteriota bacterium]
LLLYHFIRRSFEVQRQQEAERERLEAEVQHAQKLESLGTLAGGVAHDMNNILGAIMGVASLVQERHAGDPRLHKEMDTLLRAATRGRDLVRGLTDFARKGVQEAGATDLNGILAREAELLQRTTLQKIRVELDLEQNLPKVQGDASALSNAVMNLCVNAVDAMPKGGRLTLSSRSHASGQVELAIRDTGLGMPPEVLRRAMDPFFTTKPQGQGTGLGLSLAYSIAKAHHGRLELASVEGEGTTVRMLLPALTEAPAPSEAGAPTPFRRAQPTLRVLLVDDDVLLQETLLAMLQALDHQAAEAASGPEALARLAAGPVPDLVILDVNMPGMDGFEVLHHLREDHPSLPVIIISGLKDPRLDPVLVSDPAVAFLPKPFTLVELSEVIAALR